MTINAGDYVLGVHSTDGTIAALKPVGLESGGYCVGAMTSNGDMAAIGLKSMESSGSFGIVARTVDGHKVGLSSRAPYASIWVLDTDGNLVATYDTGWTTGYAGSDGSLIFTFHGNTVYAFDVSTKAIIWSLAFDNPVTCMDMYGEYLYVGFSTSGYTNKVFIRKIDFSGNIVYANTVFGFATIPGASFSATSIRTFSGGLSVACLMHVGYTTSPAVYLCSFDMQDKLAAGVAYGPTPYAKHHGSGDMLWYPYTYNYGLAFSLIGFTDTGPWSVIEYKKPSGLNVFNFSNPFSDIYSTGAFMVLPASQHLVYYTVGNVDAIWHHDTGLYHMFSVDVDTNIYACGMKKSGGASVVSYNTSGDKLWSFDTGSAANSIRKHGSRIYVSGERVAI